MTIPGQKKWYWLVVLSVVLGLLLRFWQYWYFPVAGETQDEVAWTLLGSSLLQTGEPVSWSYFQGYEVIEVMKHQSAEFPLVKPAVDHPPLFALLPGLMQTIAGHTWKAIPSIKLVRLPMVLLGSLNLVLFAWWLLRLKLSKTHTLVSLLVAATAPSIVFLSRLVVSENLIVTWLMLILLLQTYSLQGWRRWVWLAVHAALPLTKMSGIAVAAGSVAIAWLAKDKRRWQFALLGTGAGVVSLMLYMSVYDWQLFWQVQTQQAQRDTGLLTLFSTWLWEPTLVREVFADIWNQVGLIAMLALGLIYPADKKEQSLHRTVLLLFLAQLAFLLLSVGEHTIHGWYRIVFWPLWAYAIGWWVNQMWLQRNAIGFALSLILVAPQSRLAGVMALGTSFYDNQGNANKLMLLLAGLAIVSMFTSKKWQGRWQAALWISLGTVLLLSHVTSILLLHHDRFWQDALYLIEGIQP